MCGAARACRRAGRRRLARRVMSDMARRYGESRVGPQGDRRRRRGGRARPASCGSPRCGRSTAGRGDEALRPAPAARSARRSSARAAAPTGSAAHSSGSEARARRRTIWRKPKPLTAVRSNGGGRTASSAAAAAWRSACAAGSAGRSRSIRRSRAAGSRVPPRRRRQSASSAGGRRAVDVEQGHRRGRGSSAARRRRNAISPLAASSSSSDQPACLEAVGAVRARAARDRRSARRAIGAGARRRVGRAQLGALRPAGLGDRLAHDLDPELPPSLDARRQRLDAASPSPAARRSRGARGTRIAVSRPRPPRRRAAHRAARSRLRRSAPPRPAIARFSPIPSS